MGRCCSPVDLSKRRAPASKSRSYCSQLHHSRTLRKSQVDRGNCTVARRRGLYLPCPGSCYNYQAVVALTSGEHTGIFARKGACELDFEWAGREPRQTSASGFVKLSMLLRLAVHYPSFKAASAMELQGLESFPLACLGMNRGRSSVDISSSSLSMLARQHSQLRCPASCLSPPTTRL